VINVSVGAMQIVGFAASGTIIAALGTARALAVAAALMALCALVIRLGLRPRAPRGSSRAGITATWRGNMALLSSRFTRPLLLGNWTANGLIVGAEAMFVPYAGDTGAVLFVAAAVGMLIGDIVVGRWVSAQWRARQVNAMQALLAVPYLVFIIDPGLWVGAIAITVASFGYAGTLGQQQRLVDAVTDEQRGQAFGLDACGRMTFQAVGAALVGALAEVTGAATAMTLGALASLLVTALFWSVLRYPRRDGQYSEC
jgi:hypothetical protein